MKVPPKTETPPPLECTHIAADGTAVHRKRTVSDNLHTTTIVFSMSDFTTTLTVTEDKRSVTNINGRNTTPEIFLKRLPIQTEVKGTAFCWLKITDNSGCYILRQIDMGGFCFGIVDNLTRTVPSCPLGHLCVAVVIILAAYHTTAEMVVVHRHFRCGGGDHHAEQGTQAQGQGQE